MNGEVGNSGRFFLLVPALINITRTRLSLCGPYFKVLLGAFTTPNALKVANTKFCTHLYPMSASKEQYHVKQYFD